MAKEVYRGNELSQFKRLQQDACDAAQEVAGTLEEGISEIETARRLKAAMRARGIRNGVHTPLVWFGDRTCMREIRRWRDFFPTDKALGHGMPVIFEVAPIRRGFSAGIALTTGYGNNPVLRDAKRDLEEVRGRILEMVRRECTMRQIYAEVDDLITGLGYEACHHRYPFGLLGHKMGRVPFAQLRSLLRFPFMSNLPSPSFSGLDPRGLLYFGKQALQSRISSMQAQRPIWNGDVRCDMPAEPGLWAMEPHIARNGTGAKWKELLVVTETGAYWLDENVPHVRSWRNGGRMVVA